MKLDALEKRLKTLEDIEEIKKLQLRYVNNLIFADWDAVDECFADDCATEFPGTGVQRGKAEVSNYYREHVARSHIGKEGVFAVHPIVTVEGDKAKGTWLYYVLMYHPREYPPEMKDVPDWVQGIYDMEYIREKGEWKISLLKWRSRLKSIRAELKK
jgi:hypothetical protein